MEWGGAAWGGVGLCGVGCGVVQWGGVRRSAMQCGVARCGVVRCGVAVQWGGVGGVGWERGRADRWKRIALKFVRLGAMVWGVLEKSA